MTKRQLPTWAGFAPLLTPPPREGSRTERRMRRHAGVWDLRRTARRRIPRAVFDYVDGAADDEVSLERSRSLFRDLQFQPRVLRDVTEVDPSRSILGRRSAYPFGLAPTGYTRMMHHVGEPAVARVAQRAGIPYALSTVGTTTPEGVAAAAPDADRWFQLYVWRDRAFSASLVDRARAAGFRVLILTVDLPVGGNRRRDVRNGMSVPPALTLRTVLDGARHPTWWFNFLTTEPLEFATLSATGGTIADHADKIFDPALDLDDLAWLREQWDGPIVVKGLQTVADARAVVDRGADAVVLSNHGGRQLDRSTVPVRLIEPVKDEIGDEAELYVDGGILTGGDIVAAVALGADACWVGRAYLYGLMAGGEAGAWRSVEILSTEIERTMKLLGVTSLDELTTDHVRLP
jgi:L-lactate dehydrogenase (cytochrome)